MAQESPRFAMSSLSPSLEPSEAAPSHRGHIPRRFPPGGQSHIDLSTLEPVPDVKPQSPNKPFATDMYRSQTSGVQALHVTAGTTQKPVDAASFAPWAEPSDAAGRPSRLTAQLEVERQEGGRHFFAQSVWPHRGDNLGPIHTRPLSGYGLRHQQGHWESGHQYLSKSGGDLTPRGSARGTRPVSPPPISPVSASRTRPSTAHRDAFDGAQVRSLISG
jgi:hypothetical protein